MQYYLFVVMCALLGAAVARERDFNPGWKFALGEHAGAEAPGFDDRGWRDLRLPHDWSVEAPFDPNLEGATGYLPGGIGWYRKTFAAEKAEAGRLTYVLFDGIYNNAEVWLNGSKLGFHPYGYSAFYYELTTHLRPGSGNVLAVRVDRTRYADSRWYSGSGIYRNVKLITVDRMHVPIWGTMITTPQVSVEEATVEIAVTVRNVRSNGETFTIGTQIIDDAKRLVGSATQESSLAAGAETVIRQHFRLVQPMLWGLEQPRLHRAITTISQQGKEVDRYVTPFGVRSIRFDANEGFFLNGVNLKIKGVCLHHDGGLVGAAVPAGVWRRRLQILKDGGCNAIRVSHNPASEEFLQLCDEMGFLVQEEFFDEWDNPKDKRLNKWETKVDYVTQGYGEHFQEWAERDLKDTVRRGRNHPSIIQWSIGNEIEWTYPAYSKATGFFDMDWKGNYFWSTPPHSREEIRRLVREGDAAAPHSMARTAAKLAAWTRELDLTRPVILNSILPSASHESGVGDAVDILGYSYRRVMYDYGHRHFPGKVIMGTENLPQWHEWKAVMERSFISGTFLWTGIDYMGESNKQWPVKSTRSGLLDAAGFPKTGWHMYRTLWSELPHVHLATQTADKSIFKVDVATGVVGENKPGAWERSLWVWHDVNRHWNYLADEPVIIEAYSNCAELELFLNGRSLGIRRLADFPDRIFKWAVPFKPGELTVRGRKDGTAVSESLATAGKPARIVLQADRQTMAADGRDVAHIVAQLVDAAGRPVRNAEQYIDFRVEGPVRRLGVDNGAADSVQPYQADGLNTRGGRALLVVQAGQESGKVSITAVARGLVCEPVGISIE